MDATKILAEFGGRVLSFLVEVGDRIAAGREIAMLESMKMKIPLTTTISGTVSSLLVKPDVVVSEGDAVIAVTK